MLRKMEYYITKLAKYERLKLGMRIQILCWCNHQAYFLELKYKKKKEERKQKLLWKYRRKSIFIQSYLSVCTIQFCQSIFLFSYLHLVISSECFCNTIIVCTSIDGIICWLEALYAKLTELVLKIACPSI